MGTPAKTPDARCRPLVANLKVTCVRPLIGYISTMEILERYLLHIGVVVLAFMSLLPCVVLISRPRKDSEAMFWTIWLLGIIIVGVVMLLQLPVPKIFGGSY